MLGLDFSRVTMRLIRREVHILDMESLVLPEISKMLKERGVSNTGIRQFIESSLFVVVPTEKELIGSM
jgi:hypothetical protein